MAKPKPEWLSEGVLASFYGDTVRAELGPRRVKLTVKDGEAVGKVITPEQAKDLEDEVRAAKEAKKLPESRLLIDRAERIAPKAWKIYKLTDTGEPAFVREDNQRKPLLDKDGNQQNVHRFLRVDTAADFDEALQKVASLGGAA